MKLNREGLHWYAKDKQSKDMHMDASKEEMRMIKEEDDKAMRETLSLAPKCAAKSQGSNIDKNEFSELIKRGSTA